VVFTYDEKTMCKYTLVRSFDNPYMQLSGYEVKIFLTCSKNNH